MHCIATMCIPVYRFKFIPCYLIRRLSCLNASLFGQLVRHLRVKRDLKVLHRRPNTYTAIIFGQLTRQTSGRRLLGSTGACWCCWHSRHSRHSRLMHDSKHYFPHLPGYGRCDMVASQSQHVVTGGHLDATFCQLCGAYLSQRDD